MLDCITTPSGLALRVGQRSLFQLAPCRMAIIWLRVLGFVSQIWSPRVLRLCHELDGRGGLQAGDRYHQSLLHIIEGYVVFRFLSTQYSLYPRIAPRTHYHKSRFNSFRLRPYARTGLHRLGSFARLRSRQQLAPVFATPILLPLRNPALQCPIVLPSVGIYALWNGSAPQGHLTPRIRGQTRYWGEQTMPTGGLVKNLWVIQEADLAPYAASPRLWREIIPFTDTELALVRLAGSSKRVPSRTCLITWSGIRKKGGCSRISSRSMTWGAVCSSVEGWGGEEVCDSAGHTARFRVSTFVCGCGGWGGSAS